MILVYCRDKRGSYIIQWSIFSFITPGTWMFLLTCCLSTLTKADLDIHFDMMLHTIFMMLVVDPVRLFLSLSLETVLPETTAHRHFSSGQH